LARGQVLLFKGRDPANEVGSSTNVDEYFNTKLDDFLGRED